MICGSLSVHISIHIPNVRRKPMYVKKAVFPPYFGRQTFKTVYNK